jgi:hypothetical protein
VVARVIDRHCRSQDEGRSTVVARVIDRHNCSQGEGRSTVCYQQEEGLLQPGGRSTAVPGQGSSGEECCSQGRNGADNSTANELEWVEEGRILLYSVLEEK